MMQKYVLKGLYFLIMLVLVTVTSLYFVYFLQPIPLRYVEIRHAILNKDKVFSPGDIMFLKIEYCAEKYVDNVIITENLVNRDTGYVVFGRSFTVTPVSRGNCSDSNNYIISSSVPKIIPNVPGITPGRWEWQFTATVQGVLLRTYHITHYSEVFTIK